RHVLSTTRCMLYPFLFFFFSSRRRHTRFSRDWSSDVCSSDLFSFLLQRASWLAKSPKLHRYFVALPRCKWAWLPVATNSNTKKRCCAKIRRFWWRRRDVYLNWRSEERRVGQECRAGRAPVQCN